MFFLKAAGVAIEAGSALVFELCWRQGASFEKECRGADVAPIFTKIED